MEELLDMHRQPTLIFLIRNIRKNKLPGLPALRGHCKKINIGYNLAQTALVNDFIMLTYIKFKSGG